MIPPVPMVIVSPGRSSVSIARSSIEGGIHPRGPARLDRLERPVALDPAADFVDQVAERDPERDLHQPGVLDGPFQGENRGPGSPLRAHPDIPSRSPGEDRRDAGPGLHVVDHRGFTPKAAGHGIRGTGPRLAGMPFERFDQRGFFPADIGPGPTADGDAERPTAAKHVVAQKPAFFGLLNGVFENLDGQRVLVADVDEPFPRRSRRSR